MYTERPERDGFRTAGGTFQDLCHYGILENEYTERRWWRHDLEND